MKEKAKEKTFPRVKLRIFAGKEMALFRNNKTLLVEAHFVDT